MRELFTLLNPGAAVIELCCHPALLGSNPHVVNRLDSGVECVVQSEAPVLLYDMVSRISPVCACCC